MSWMVLKSPNEKVNFGAGEIGEEIFWGSGVWIRTGVKDFLETSSGTLDSRPRTALPCSESPPASCPFDHGANNCSLGQAKAQCGVS